MEHKPQFRYLVLIIIVVISSALLVMGSKRLKYKNISGFSAATNKTIKTFLYETRKIKGPKAAVFDLDGTVMGQAPYYLADESLYQYALNHPAHKPNLVRKMMKQLNTSKEYIANRVHYFAGLTPLQLQQIGNETFNRKYRHKIFPQMQQLINNLKANGFEIWVVSASPEFIYQDFVAKNLRIPVTHVIGIKSVVKNGITTNQIIWPVAQDDGKVDAIETFIKAKPLFAAGNSADDVEMLNFSKGLSMIVNPDAVKHIDKLNGAILRDFAKKHNWLIVHITDKPPLHTRFVSKKFHIRVNDTHD